MTLYPREKMEKDCNSLIKSKIIPIQKDTPSKEPSKKIIPLAPQWSVKNQNPN